MYCRLYNDDTYWLVHYVARYYRIIKHHQHVLVVNKKSIMNHTLAYIRVFNVGWKKVEVAKEEGIRAWGKQFYVFAPRRIDFMLHFYWLVSKRGSWQQTHCAMIMLNFWHCQKNIVGYLWSQYHDNFEPVSYDTGPPIRSHDHINHHDCFTIPIFRKTCAVCLGL